MKRNNFAKILAMLAFCGFVLSCGTVPKFSTAQAKNDYTSVNDILANVQPVDLSVGKKLTKTINTSDVHLYITADNYRTAVKLFKTAPLAQGEAYKITVHSLCNPYGLTGSILMPMIDVYDSDFAQIPVQQISGKALGPGMIDPLSYLAEYSFSCAESGIFYIMLSADMKSEKGVTLRTVNEYGQLLWTKEFEPIPYAKFRIRIDQTK